MTALADRQLTRRMIIEARRGAEDELLIGDIEAQQRRLPRASGGDDVGEQERRGRTKIRRLSQRREQREASVFRRSGPRDGGGFGCHVDDGCRRPDTGKKQIPRYARDDARRHRRDWQFSGIRYPESGINLPSPT